MKVRIPLTLTFDDCDLYDYQRPSSSREDFRRLMENESSGEGHFDDNTKASGAATPVAEPSGGKNGKRKGTSKKAKTVKEKLAIIDGGG